MFIHAKDHVAGKPMPSENDHSVSTDCSTSDVFIFYKSATSPTKMLVMLLAGFTVNYHDYHCFGILFIIFRYWKG